jgi:gamma-glutamylcyclotransferase (GGCT)/AIG2-like uncharacterized protein YtfP
MLTRIKSYSQFINESQSVEVSESLNFHISNSLSIAESVYRPFSKSHLDLLKEARELFESKRLKLSGLDNILFSTTDIGKFAVWEGNEVPLDVVFELDQLNEAEYDGRKVELGKPMRGGSKKYVVYVMNPSTKRVKKIQFGDPGLSAKVSNPKARKSFAARHQCHKKKDRLMAGYWACRINRYAHLWGGKTYPGYW